jgi:hypothetical protein
MMPTSGRVGHRSVPPVRRLVGVVLGIGLAACACGNSVIPANTPGPGLNGSGGVSGGSLTAGLSSGLAKLTSYKFTESNAGVPGGSSAPSGGSTYSLSGTVVNSPVASVWVKEAAAQFLVVGADAWTSIDGTTWSQADSQAVGLSDLLPGSEYASWFDPKAGYFTFVGNETKNNVDCAHYRGNSALSSIYSGLTGGTATFGADVWIARDGNYPVSGVYGYSGGASGKDASWGFAFDITDVNSSANTVAVPTNVVAIPT